ncbi:synaptogenesis protein syg-2-like [Limulus polyphemus]|uniref:Synaptogenesis protein syg-2-like n=1 Tax=Limulus polyphemus TaxID=6850 RepID=A0ABM1TLD6_LIMPO|nr:synaptogenesis protein syg-2-like [Limulus polyphemus]
MSRFTLDICVRCQQFTLCFITASILYTAVVRGKVALPCDISSPSTDDSAALILWYKDDSAQPIYTLDSRRGNVDQAHQSSGPQLENRAYFNMINRPAFLQLDPVKEEDAGEYRCRVDFHKARTVNTVITLKVIVPPREPLIVDENGQQLKGLVGPFNEGQSLTLTCSVTGGKPRPSLTWWRDYTLLDDNYTFCSDEIVENRIFIPELEREDFRVVLTCQASNNNITIPASTTVTLKLNLKPSSVEITSSQRPMSANREVKLTCVARGSRPPATLTWWKGSEKVDTSNGSVVTEGETTTSTFTFLPTVEDNGKYLACRAENTKIPGSGIEDSFNMEVRYSPKVSLRVTSNSKNGLQEGDDATFGCDIKANPWVYKIKWYFNGVELFGNSSLGVLISSQSMVVQNVKRRFRGLFSCSATNSEGLGTSDEIFLKVKYSPVCQPGQKLNYGAIHLETIQVQCKLDSDPNDITFYWRFNSSTKVTDNIPHSVSGNKYESTASYTIETDEDYGTLLCWGENKIGIQKDPCIFKVMHAEPPDPVENCSVFNRTTQQILIKCLEGFDGGLDQTFLVEVYKKESRALHSKVSSPVPVFPLNNLTPGSFYTLLVYAVNRRGRSSAVTLTTSTIRLAEKLTGEKAGMFVSSSILAVFIGATVALILLVLILIVVVKIRKKRILKVQQENDPANKPEASLKKTVSDVTEGPDIIPAKNMSMDIYLACYDNDPDQKFFQFHATPSSTRSYSTDGELLDITPSSSKGTIYMPEMSYRSPIHKSDIRSGNLTSPYASLCFFRLFT